MVGCLLVVHYWAHLQSVHGFRCNDNIAPNAKCQRVLVLALCLVGDNWGISTTVNGYGSGWFCVPKTDARNDGISYCNCFVAFELKVMKFPGDSWHMARHGHWDDIRDWQAHHRHHRGHQGNNSSSKGKCGLLPQHCGGHRIVRRCNHFNVA